jgi:hypothetical protein
MEKAGARLVELRDLALDVPVLVDELDVQKYEFKDAINGYLLRSDAPIRTLGELVASGNFTRVWLRFCATPRHSMFPATH